MTSSTLLSIRGLRKSFAGLVATDDVSIDVMPREIHALIGPNGAGKSTLVNLISGMLRGDAGQIELAGSRIEHLPPHARVRAGLSRCFQITSIFPADSVLDNLRIALQAHQAGSYRLYGRRDAEKQLLDESVQLAHSVGLQNRLDDIAGTLPHGAQRQLDVALALAANPRVLLLDEPMAGMGPDESERMARLIEELRSRVAILLVEHDMQAVFRLSDRISVLVYGRVLVTGTPEEIRSDERVRDVYLGSEVAA